ncbi:ABC-2 type transporter [Pseudopedobacter saltans DSM 12145]|uniref:ABC-2 type transporter n=1 Tax=Pseudopedobacter saltans (strain ATCC 51119 / DSM 12145 / JCM 21818 / CCUG 39354 / LMG 10337 / NBRC 100064 / NCIMB 13643) TaxID=762903 RepID=F0SBZ0_PSESL|nr:ABC transporter permease [Pseudopedobacter saltans]ADY53831.1 ABC-2 type transporter [Pseudopedobacter saltans DSM 12145]
MKKTDFNFRSFKILVRKEISDYIKSWKFIILLGIVLLTCIASLYNSLSVLRKNIPAPNDPDSIFFFLKIFTTSDGTLPPFHVFVGFLGPLLGICLGFDAVNSEFNNRTISRILSQPIHRDSFLNAKFIGALLIIACLFSTLFLLTTGVAIIWTGLSPTFQECGRLLLFLLLTIVYVGFWLNLSILFSVLWRSPATSALIGIAIWLFFTVFYPLIVNVIAKRIMPDPYSSYQEIKAYQDFMLTLTRFAPNQLFDDGTNILLMPSIRSLGPLSMEQVQGAIPSPLPIWESIKIVWDQLTGLLASTIICFALSYFSFMRREIRA